MLKQLSFVLALFFIIGCSASTPRQLNIAVGVYEPIQIAAEACVYDAKCYQTEERKQLIQNVTRSVTTSFNDARTIVNECNFLGCDDVTEQFALISTGLRALKPLVLDAIYGPSEAEAIIAPALNSLEEGL